MTTECKLLRQSITIPVSYKLPWALFRCQMFNQKCLFVCFWRNSPQWARASSFTRFLDHTRQRATVGRTPLDEQSARPRDLYLTTHNTHNRKISMPPVGFEPTISPGEWPQTYALDRAATGTGSIKSVLSKYHIQTPKCLGVSQQCLWQFKSAGMWQCVTGCVILGRDAVSLGE